MISEEWKQIIIQERSHLNQLVILFKQNYQTFNERVLEEFTVPYFTALSKSLPDPKDNDTVSQSFEILLKLIQKGVFRNPHGEKEMAILDVISKIPGPLNENLNLTLSHLVNALSKLKSSSEIKFLSRLSLISSDLYNLKDLNHSLIVLAWLGGHPEYRASAMEVFDSLPERIRTNVSKELQIPTDTFVSIFTHSPFGNQNAETAKTVRYKIISGYPLHNGNFYKVPTLLNSEANTIVCSGENFYEVYFDSFGESIFPTSKIKGISKTQITSPFWNQIIKSKFQINDITSVIESEEYLVITLKNSYMIFLFYRS